MSKDIRHAVKKIYGNSVINLLDDISINKLDNKHVIEKALEIEKKYGITLSSLIAEDRGLGQGYFINSDKIFKKRADKYSTKISRASCAKH